MKNLPKYQSNVAMYDILNNMECYHRSDTTIKLK